MLLSYFIFSFQRGAQQNSETKTRVGYPHETLMIGTASLAYVQEGVMSQRRSLGTSYIAIYKGSLMPTILYVELIASQCITQVNIVMCPHT